MTSSQNVFTRKGRSFADDIEEYHQRGLDSLISAGSLLAVKKLTSSFPPGVSSFWGYELPLVNPARHCDFLCCIHRPEEFAKVFNDDYSMNESRMLTHSALKNFVVNWCDTDNAWSGQVDNIWLEFDGGDLLSEKPVANFFFGPKTMLNNLEFVFVCEQVFKNFKGITIENTTWQLLLDCLFKTGRGYISQVGRMMARENKGLRLFIQGLPPYGIRDYLNAISYPIEERDELLKLLTLCYEHAERVELNIDISDRVGDDIGLECYFTSTARALSFLDVTRASGWCDNQTYELLQKHLREIAVDASQIYQHFFSHFKLVYSPTKGIRAKAYLGFVHSDIAPGIIKAMPVNEFYES